MFEHDFHHSNKYLSNCTKILGADTDMPQIVRVRRVIRADDPRAITARVVDARANKHVRIGVARRGRRAIRKPVLHVCVVVAKVMAGKARHRVVKVRHAVLATSLGRDELGKGLIANTRGAEGIEIAGTTIVVSPARRRTPSQLVLVRSPGVNMPLFCLFVAVKETILGSSTGGTYYAQPRVAIAAPSE